MPEQPLPDTLPPEHIESLLAGRVTGELPPWSQGNEAQVETWLRRQCAELERALHLSSRIEWDHYGSGTASFVDAWFYRATAEFTVTRPAGYAFEYTGLVVLFNRFAPYFAMSQGEQGWDPVRGYRYMPAWGDVDRFTNPSVLKLSVQVAERLQRAGWRRLSSAQLALPLLTETPIVTNLSSGAPTLFDALFHWED